MITHCNIIRHGFLLLILFPEVSSKSILRNTFILRRR